MVKMLSSTRAVRILSPAASIPLLVAPAEGLVRSLELEVCLGRLCLDGLFFLAGAVPVWICVFALYGLDHKRNSLSVKNLPEI